MKMAQVIYGPGGWQAEWYRDEDANSGYGANPRRAVWYGTRNECEAVARNANPPKGAVWAAIDGWHPDMSPGSAAWCENYADNH